VSWPVGTVILFGEDGHMWWVGDPSIAEEMIEAESDVCPGYDSRGRLLRAVRGNDGWRLEVASEKSEEAVIRARVRAYYRYRSRIPGLEPPEADDLERFLDAAADDRLEE
jgi:hypothetical protein